MAAEQIPPVFGEIYRTYYPTAISDYLGISTCTWSTGTTGVSGAWPVDYNILYYHFTIANDTTTFVEKISQPIRWICDVPTVDSDPWDWWGGVGDLRYEETVEAYQISTGGTLSNRNNIIGLSNGLLPISGDSHVQPPTTYAQMTVSKGRLKSPPIVASAYTIPNIEALSANLAAPVSTGGAGLSYDVYAYRYRVNGTILDPGDLASTSVVAGDVLDLDVWYRIRYVPRYGGGGATARKACAYVSTSTVASGNRNCGNTGPGFLVFSGFKMAGASFNAAVHTYSLTLSGGDLELPGGGLGGTKMISQDGWTATITSGYIQWTKDAGSLSVGIEQIRLEFLRENVVLIVYLTAAFATANSIQRTIAYTPANDGNYLQTTFDSDSALTVTHAGNGCFNQTGSTTFSLVPWSPDNAVSSIYYWHGGDTSGLTVPHSELPSSIVVARTVQ